MSETWCLAMSVGRVGEVDVEDVLDLTAGQAGREGGGVHEPLLRVELDVRVLLGEGGHVVHVVLPVDLVGGRREPVDGDRHRAGRVGGVVGPWSCRRRSARPSRSPAARAAPHARRVRERTDMASLLRGASRRPLMRADVCRHVTVVTTRWICGESRTGACKK